jgi:hypothetical protein
MTIDRFPRHTHEALKFYVYIYIDPRNGEVFYVGKGRGNRAFEHLKDRSETRKVIRIAEIRDAAKKPEIKILIHGLPDEDAALKVEAAVTRTCYPAAILPSAPVWIVRWLMNQHIPSMCPMAKSLPRVETDFIEITPKPRCRRLSCSGRLQPRSTPARIEEPLLQGANIRLLRWRCQVARSSGMASTSRVLRCSTAAV